MKSGIKLKKPISVWNKPLKTNFGDFFKSLSKLVAHSAAGNWTDAAIDVAEALTQLGLSTEAGEKAWLLLRGAIERSMVELAFESALQEQMMDTEGTGVTFLLTFNDQVFALVKRGPDQGDWVIAAS